MRSSPFHVRSLVRALVLGLASTSITIAAVGSADAQAATRPAQGAIALDAPIPIDPAVRAGWLPNGLRYYIRQNTRPEKRVELRLVVNAGSVQEDDDQRGMAHFVEHMLFNGTRRFKKNDIVKYLESIGVRFGADLNAYTGFDETVYILPVPTDKPELVQRSFEILEDWASGALFDSTDVVGERGVVLEEWRGGLGAESRIRDKQFPVFFKGSRYAERLPIGDPEIIRNANPSPLRRFYRDWYRPDLMAVVAVGDIDPAQIEERIRTHFSALRAPAQPRPRVSPPVPPHDETLVTIATDREEQIASLQVVYKRDATKFTTARDYRALLVRRLHTSILNQRFGEISRRPDAPFSFASSGFGQFVRSTDVYQLATAAKEGASEQALEAVLTEARRVDQHGFLASELERTKAALLRGLESAHAERDKSESGDLAGEYVGHFLNGEPVPGIAWEFEAAKQMLPTITLAEVIAFGREWIGDRNRVIALSAPEKDGENVPSEAQLRAIVARVDASSVTAYTETVSDAPLVATSPPGGRIANESGIPELGLTEWRLSNGIRVLLKPTDFKADEILMSAWSPGGSSLVSDADYPSAMLSTAAVERGGLSTFDAIELQKKLTGKRASVSPFIGDMTEGFSGRASPKDLETLFQLVFLRATSPRRDSVAFDAFRAQVAPFLANRANSPEEVFGDTVLVTMAQNHPRQQPLSRALLDRAAFGRAFDIYRDRFADLSDFTFLFVGAFQVDSIRPLVERWLASLPAGGRREAGKDLGVRGPDGVVEKRVRKGVEPKANQLIYFTGPATFSPVERHALRSLSELLEMRLLDNLREALGSTYSVGVSGSMEKHPREEYSLRIAFGSAPEKVDTLFRTVLAVIDSVRTIAPSDEDVQKVREQQLRTLEVSQRENGYWLTNIAARFENGEDPRGLLQYEQLVRGLTGAKIQQAARTYANTARYARFILLPERTAQ
jgi:zinc protease